MMDNCKNYKEMNIYVKNNQRAVNMKKLKKFKDK